MRSLKHILLAACLILSAQAQFTAEDDSLTLENTLGHDPALNVEGVAESDTVRFKDSGGDAKLWLVTEKPDNTLTIQYNGVDMFTLDPVVPFSAAGEDRVFADDTTVAPITPGAPTVAEMTAFSVTGPYINTTLFYTGTDVNTDPVTHAYLVDNAGAVTLAQEPAAKNEFQELVFGATVPWDGSLGRNGRINLTGDATISTPSNIISGQIYHLIMTATGGDRTVSFGLGYSIAASSNVKDVKISATENLIYTFVGKTATTMEKVMPYEYEHTGTLHSFSGTAANIKGWEGVPGLSDDITTDVTVGAVSSANFDQNPLGTHRFYNFRITNTDASSHTVTFNSSWNSSTGEDLGVVTLDPAESFVETFVITNSGTAQALTVGPTVDGEFQELVYGATVPWDGSLGRDGRINLTGDATINTPSNIVSGKIYRLIMTATGGNRTVSFGFGYNIAASSNVSDVKISSTENLIYTFVGQSATSMEKVTPHEYEHTGTLHSFSGTVANIKGWEGVPGLSSDITTDVTVGSVSSAEFHMHPTGSHRLYNFRITNTDASPHTVTFDASWDASTGVDIGVVTLQPAETFYDTFLIINAGRAQGLTAPTPIRFYQSVAGASPGASVQSLGALVNQVIMSATPPDAHRVSFSGATTTSSYVGDITNTNQYELAFGTAGTYEIDVSVMIGSGSGVDAGRAVMIVKNGTDRVGYGATRTSSSGGSNFEIQVRATAILDLVAGDTIDVRVGQFSAPNGTISVLGYDLNVKQL